MSLDNDKCPRRWGERSSECPHWRTTVLHVRKGSACWGQRKVSGGGGNVGPFQVSRSWPTLSLRTETAWGKSQGTWITQKLDYLPERAKDQLPSGKQQKGRNGDKRQAEEPLCLMRSGYVKSGLHTPQFPGRCFSQGWVYEKRKGQSSRQGQSRYFSSF